MLEKILDRYYDETFLKAEGFDKAVIGVDSVSLRLIYSNKKCIEILCKQMSRKLATEYFYFNVCNTYLGEKSPIFSDDLF